MTIHETPTNPPSHFERLTGRTRRKGQPAPLADVLRASTLATIQAARDAQASRILDALDALVDPRQAGAFGADEHGVAWVRHPTLGTFRGTSMRDALAQLLTARGLL